MALIRLTDVCNQNCLFCNFTEEVKPLDLTELKKELLVILKTGDRELVFSGGEPTVYPQILSAIKLAKEVGFTEIELQTNGLLLANPQLVKEYQQVGLTAVFIGLHSNKPEIYDQLTGVKGGFTLAVQAIKNLLAAKIKVRINIVINKLNYEQLLDLTRYIHENFPKIESIDYSFIVSQGKTLKNAHLVPKISEVVPDLISAYKYCQKNKIKFNNPICGIPVCFVPDYKEYSTEYLNLKRGRENDFSQKNADNKIKLVKCQTCPELNYCSGIWRGYVDIKGQAEFN